MPASAARSLTRLCRRFCCTKDRRVPRRANHSLLGNFANTTVAILMPTASAVMHTQFTAPQQQTGSRRARTSKGLGSCGYFKMAPVYAVLVTPGRASLSLSIAKLHRMSSSEFLPPTQSLLLSDQRLYQLLLSPPTHNPRLCQTSIGGVLTMRSRLFSTLVPLL